MFAARSTTKLAARGVRQMSAAKVRLIFIAIYMRYILLRIPWFAMELFTFSYPFPSTPPFTFFQINRSIFLESVRSSMIHPVV